MRDFAHVASAILCLSFTMLPCQLVHACSGESAKTGSRLTVVVTFHHARYGLSSRVVSSSAELVGIPSARGETFADDVPAGLVSVDVDETSCGFGPYLLKTTTGEAQKIVAARKEGRLSLMREATPPTNAGPPDHESNHPFQKPRSVFSMDGQTFEMNSDGVVHRTPGT